MAISRAFPLAVETIDRQMAGFVETADIPEGRQAGRQAGVSIRRFRGNFVGTTVYAKTCEMFGLCFHRTPGLMLEQFSTASFQPANALITRLRYRGSMKHRASSGTTI